MKNQKVFVRYKNFNDSSQQGREREVKKTYADKKKFIEKTNKARQPLRQIIESFQPLDELPLNIKNLIQNFPKFFTKESKAPEKDSNQYLNEFVIFRPKKFIQNFYKDPRKEEPASSQDPDWNSDEDIDNNLESQKIDENLVEKIVEKYGDKLVKKQQILKRHEKQFLQDHFRGKRLRQVEEIIEIPKKEQKKKSSNKEIQKKDTVSKEEKQEENKEQKRADKAKENIWSQYQQKQVNNFVDLGFMTKIQDNDEQQIEAELAQDDGMFLEQDEVEKEEEKKVSSSEQSDGEDIFGDDQSTTIKNTYKSQNKIQQDKKQVQGMVFINDLSFNKIAQQVGLLPSRCAWIIRNDKEKYKVTTEYMDTIYRKQKMNEMFPQISLNHSEFVYNDEIDLPETIEIFRKFNARRKNNQNGNQNGNHSTKRTYSSKNYKKQFKEKPTHNKNK